MNESLLHNIMGELDDFRTMDAQGWLAAPVPGHSGFWLCRNTVGAIALMIRWNSDVVAKELRAWELGQVVHQRPRSHRLCHTVSGQEETLNLGLLMLESVDDEDRIAHFLNLLSELLVEPLSQVPVADQDRWLADSIEGLRELFYQEPLPKRSTIIGLWGELWALAASENVADTARAWHSDPDQIDDFRLGSQRVDVKTTTRELRQHDFRLNQLDVLSHVFSIRVMDDPDGLNVGELLDNICLALKNDPVDLVRRVRLIVYRTVGDTQRAEVAKVRLSPIEGPHPAKLYRKSDVPSVVPDNGVESVHFTSDLSGISAMIKDEICAVGGVIEHWQQLGT